MNKFAYDRNFLEGLQSFMKTNDEITPSNTNGHINGNNTTVNKGDLNNSLLLDFCKNEPPVEESQNFSLVSDEVGDMLNECEGRNPQENHENQNNQESTLKDYHQDKESAESLVKSLTNEESTEFIFNENSSNSNNHSTSQPIYQHQQQPRKITAEEFYEKHSDKFDFVDPSYNFAGNYQYYVSSCLSSMVKMKGVDLTKEIEDRKINLPSNQNNPKTHSTIRLRRNACTF